MIRFEGYDRRIDKITGVLKEYGFTDLEQVRDFTLSKGVDVDAIVREIQPIAFDNAVWAYTLGAGIALKKGYTDAAQAAEWLGYGLQAFCIPGSVADQRDVGLGHGNLAAMLLREETKC
ncbi:MAG: GGGtGRT protein, partial [Clostridia bacterium]|nr:GGGtGRT protein [Clostridia bacterium]